MVAVAPVEQVMVTAFRGGSAGAGGDAGGTYRDRQPGDVWIADARWCASLAADGGTRARPSVRPKEP